MQLRQFIAIHSPTLGLTNHQGVAAAKVLGRGVDSDAFKATGLGPNSGPEATPFNAALWLLSAAVGGPQTRVAGAVQRLFSTLPADIDAQYQPGIVDDARPVREHRMAHMFGDILTGILADPARAAEVDRIEVRHGSADATLVMGDGTRTRFVSVDDSRQTEARDARGELHTVTTIGGALLAAFAETLAGKGVA